ncbi:MAG: hypothetical protein QME79_02825 [Bacillota bacterium]|nr:hypothetical protein [Bacillota bacterium]
MERSAAGERGQVVVAAVLAVVLAGLAWEALVTAWAATRDRLVVQNSLDAGVTTGAAVLADGLNTLAIINRALLALGITAMLGRGEYAYWAAQLQRAQDEVIRRTPALAKQAAWGTAVGLGAQGVRFPPGAGGQWPSLMVRRVYLLPWLLGSQFPLWIADDLHPVRDRRWGNRVVYLEGWRLNRRGAGQLPFRARAGAAASRRGGGRSSWPLLATDFDSRLIPFGGEEGAGHR